MIAGQYVESIIQFYEMFNIIFYVHILFLLSAHINFDSLKHIYF